MLLVELNTNRNFQKHKKEKKLAHQTALDVLASVSMSKSS